MAVRSDEKIPGLCVYPPCVNFIFWKLTGDGARTADLAEVLKAQLADTRLRQLSRLSAAYGRTAVRTHEENERFVALLAENIR